MLAGTGPPYPSSLVDRVAEPEGVPSLVFGQAVVALGSGVGVPGEDRRLDRRPPCLGGGGQAVCLGRVGGCRLLVEAIRPRPDEVALRIGAGQVEQGAEFLLDPVSYTHLTL